MTAAVKVRMLSAWRGLPVGRIVEVTGGVADILCNRRRPRVAEYVKDDDSAPVAAVPGVQKLPKGKARGQQ